METRKFIAFLVIAIFSMTNSFALSYINVDKLIGKNINLANKINNAIDQSLKEYGYAYVKFTKSKTYTFSNSIILKNNVTIDGNGCIIRFDTDPNTNAMYLYNSFLTNRKIQVKGDIETYTYQILGNKNMSIKNIDFECNNDNQFWFNADCERGIIAFHGAENVTIDHVIFNNTRRNTPIWMTNMKNVEIKCCKFFESSENNNQQSSCGAIWSNNGSYLDHINIHDNIFRNYRDESISICATAGTNSYLNNISIINNLFYSKYYAITILNSKTVKSKGLYIKYNTFCDFQNQTAPIVLENGGTYQDVNIIANHFNSTKLFDALSVVAKTQIDSLIFYHNIIKNGTLCYSYLLFVNKLCYIRGNEIDNAQKILGITSFVPVYITNNNFFIRKANGQNLFSINAPQEQVFIKNNLFRIYDSDNVALTSEYGYGYSICKNRLTFENNEVTFKNSNTTFFKNNELGKNISVSIANNSFKGLSVRKLRYNLNNKCIWTSNIIK